MKPSTAVTPKAVLQAIAVSTLVAGALDIGDAVVMSTLRGRGPMFMLQGIAGGILGPSARQGGLATAAFGLAVHFAIMAGMAAAFVLASTRFETLRRRPVRWGVAYGLGLYVAMNYVVLPLRWPGLWPKLEAIPLINQTMAHTLLVGVPIALITAAILGRPSRA